MKIKISIAFLILFNVQFVGAQASIRGINLVSPVYEAKQMGMDEIVQIHANWVALCPWAFMDNNSPDVYFNTMDNYWGDRPENMVKMIQAAHDENLMILLKPHFWVRGYGWPGELQMNEAGWLLWEKNYAAFVLEMAKFASANAIEMYCIGVEFKTAIQQRPEFWQKLIKDVRQVYSGKLLYAANWDNYRAVDFWDQLDYIGIDAYFPLVDKANPGLAELKSKWSKEAKTLQDYSMKQNKPIVFTEYGYRSSDFAAWNQWEIEQLSPDQQLNLQIQENAYTALYESVWGASWLAGGFIWKWYPDLLDAGGSAHSGYTPQNKPVMKIIKKWYTN